MEEEFDFANIMGVVFTAIGGYSDVEELCLNTLQATAEDADAEFVDMVVHLKTRIMGVLSSQETCASVLNGLNDGFDGMLDVTVLGFSSMDELCAELTSAFEFDSASDTSVENSESSQMEEFTIGDAFKIVGLLSSAETLYDGALIYCSIMREISEDQVIGSICGVIESDLVAGLMHQCSEMVEDDSESIEWPDVGDVVWLDDVIPIQDIVHTVMGVMNFNFESVDSSLVCPAVQMLSQEGTSIGGMLPHFFDQLMMLNMHMGAFLCQNKDAGGEFGQMVGVVLSAVAGYDDADQLCIDLAEAMSEDADPSMAEEMSSRLEMRIKALLLDESTCVSALVEIDDGLGGMLDLSVLGFASVDDFCATMTSITDIVFEFDVGSEIWSSETKSETKSERMMPSEWMPSEMTAADVMSLGARFLHVDSVYSGAVLVCDMLPYMMDSSFEIIGGMCDMLMSDEMTALIEECHEGPSIPEWLLENGGMDWAEDLLSLDSLFGAVTDFLGLNTTDAEEICNTLIGILSDRQTPLAVYLDTALDHVLLENLYMGAYLCADDEDQQSNDDKSERSDWFGKSSDGMDGYSEWSDDNGDDMYGCIMGVVFTALGGYNDTDGLCRDVLAVTADGVDSSLVSGMVSHVKSRIMAVLQLKETCVSVLSQINDEFGGLLSLGLIEFGSIDGFCSELTTAMDPESSFQLDIESFDWPSVPMSEFFQRPSALLSGISITDALGVVGQILNAGSLYDGSLILCSTVGHMFGVDESAGAGGLFRDVCQLLENDDMDTLSQECVDLILAEFPSEFLLEQSEIEVCFGIPDCLGVCNGDATADCAGVCNGNGTLDCALRCNGDAYINECSECVGGTTGRSTDFGIDKCGYCKKVRGYRITWDCYGTCNGTASFDKCGECVGGETGLEDNANDGRLDCRDICDGGWILDDCGYCEPSDGSNSTASKYMDCSGTCVLPGFDRAYENECGICVGGNTNLTDDEGKNDCGCNGVVSATSCLGCDGVANSGKTYDACGVCGGTGTDCVGVGWVVPNFIPADTQIELTIIGAGFTQGSTLSCIFEATDGTQTETQMIVYNSTTVITCMSPALAMDNYTITIRRDSDQPTDIGASLYTYQDVNITSIDPVEIVLDSSVTSLTITATAEAGAFSDIRNLPYAVPTLILAGTIFADGQGSYEGQFVSDTEIEFEVETPSVSCRVYGTPTVNGYTGLGTTKVSPVTMTAYAAAPNMESAQFSNNGAGILVTFDTGVQYKDFTSCSDIFDDASNALLGVGSECFFRDPKRLIIVIGKAVTLIEPGDVLTLRSGAVKTFHQDYSHDASGNITVAGPQQALQPTALLDGAPKIPSCGDVRISGRRSTGSGARTMTYTWDVQSEGNMTNVTAALSGLNSPDLELDGELIDADTPYNFSLTVTNFLGESDIAYYVVERSAVALPQIKVVSKGVDVSSASVSDSFDLTAEVTFYSECVPPGTTQFSWSVDNSDVPLNLKTMYKRTLYVDANSLPGDQVITFTVQVHKDSDPDKVATASIQVATVSTPLVATIRGGAEITVGRDSGDVEIDGSSSEDPDNVAVDMSYEWTCTQVTDNAACYSYKSGEEGQLFPATTDSAILVFDALSMGADKTYEFTLTISKLTREASASVRVSAVSGNPPQVSVEIENSDENKVTEDEIVTIRSLVKHTVPLVSVVFESVDTDTGYGYFNFSDLNGLVTVPKIHSSPDGTRSLANVILKAGQLVKGTSYSVQVTATDEDGQSSSSKVSAFVLV
ncbi:uncharacterized protein [Ptychodera flava]|uniref:uncharacterized protein n=1 Tax=Ptychodera flava TaxID=63121 RepID=UPI00396A9D3B